MTLWAIGYTLDNKRRPRKGPYIFPWTVRETREQSWAAWNATDGVDTESKLYRTLRKRFGAKAFKVRIVVVIDPDGGR